MIALRRLEPLHTAFARIVSSRTAADLAALQVDVTRPVGAYLDRLGRDGRPLADAVRLLLAREEGSATTLDEFVADLQSGVSWAIRLARDPRARLLPQLNVYVWLALLAWLAVRGFGGPPDVPDRNRRCRQRMHDWHVHGVVRSAFRDAGRDAEAASRAADFVAGIQELPMWAPVGGAADASAVIASWLADRPVRRALGVNDLEGRGDRPHFDYEAYDELVAWTTWVAAVRLAEYPQAYRGGDRPMIDWVTELSRDLERARDAGDPAVIPCLRRF